MRRTLITAILAVWLASMVLLVRSRDDRPGQSSMPTAMAPLPAGTTADRWFEIYLQDHKVGFVQYALVEEGQGIRFLERSVLQMNTLGTKQTIHSTAWGSMNAAYELRELHFALATGATTFEADVRVEDGALIIDTGSKDGAPSLRLPLDGAVSMPLGLRSALLRQPLQEGRLVAGTVFDPLTQKKSSLTLKVVGRERLPGNNDLEAWRIEESWREVRSELWVNEEGELLREEGPMGLVAVAASEEDATRLDDVAEGTWDAVAAVSIPVPVPIEDARRRPELRVRLKGIELDSVPVGEGQTIDDDVLTIRRADLELARSYSLPYADGDHQDELGSTIALQKDHPRIRALTRTILGPERDALRATEMLVRWVHEYLAKVAVAGLPNALETLDRGTGDCTEHAVLFAALARSAGIPTRLVAGTVYGPDAFLYHAWAEVWLGRWLPVDPALGQVPADATHVTLVYGGLEEQMSMMRLLGKLTIDIVGDERGIRRR